MRKYPERIKAQVKGNGLQQYYYRSEGCTVYITYNLHPDVIAYAAMYGNRVNLKIIRGNILEGLPVELPAGSCMVAYSTGVLGSDVSGKRVFKTSESRIMAVIKMAECLAEQGILYILYSYSYNGESGVVELFYQRHGNTLKLIPFLGVLSMPVEQLIKRNISISREGWPVTIALPYSTAPVINFEKNKATEGNKKKENIRVLPVPDPAADIYSIHPLSDGELSDLLRKAPFGEITVTAELAKRLIRTMGLDYSSGLQVRISEAFKLFSLLKQDARHGKQNTAMMEAAGKEMAALKDTVIHNLKLCKDKEDGGISLVSQGEYSQWLVQAVK
ncbi:MAG: hypothetical protein PHE58_02020, partial [Candidatus Omnitrophica bacterium]|nr:hypothetical protein [Candidatus Omnitrophota bacterium]